jgi:hypothetical protein
MIFMKLLVAQLAADRAEDAGARGSLSGLMSTAAFSSNWM